MPTSELYEGYGAAFCPGSRRTVPGDRNSIWVRNITSGAIVRFDAVPLDSGSLQISGSLDQPDSVEYQLVSGCVTQQTGRWGVALEDIPSQEWGRVQVCGVAVVATLPSYGSYSDAVAPGISGVYYCSANTRNAVRVLVPGEGSALVTLDDRGGIETPYSGYFKLVDASTYDSATGEMLSAAVRVVDGASPMSSVCGVTDLPSAGIVSAVTLTMSGGTVSLYGWFDSATSSYAVCIDSSDSSVRSASEGAFGSFQLGRVWVDSGRLRSNRNFFMTRNGPVNGTAVHGSRISARRL